MPCPGQNIHCRAEHRSVEALRLGVSQDNENVYGVPPGEVDFAGGIDPGVITGNVTGMPHKPTM